MIIKNKNFDELKGKPLHLCYVENIHRQYQDYDEESKKKLSLPLDKRGYMNIREYENPEYIPGEAEYYAYFTDVDFEKISNDDFCDMSEEYFSGDDLAFDTDFVSAMKENEEFSFHRVPFCPRTYSLFLPSSWSSKCPFTVADINSGVIAWICDYSEDFKKRTSIFAGCFPEEFEKFLEKVSENNPDYIQE